MGVWGDDAARGNQYDYGMASPLSHHDPEGTQVVVGYGDFLAYRNFSKAAGEMGPVATGFAKRGLEVALTTWNSAGRVFSECNERLGALILAGNPSTFLAEVKRDVNDAKLQMESEIATLSHLPSGTMAMVQGWTAALESGDSEKAGGPCLTWQPPAMASAVS